VDRRALAALALAAAFGLLAAGCGRPGSSAGPVYTAKGTAPCLKTKGFRAVTTNRLKIGLIAGTAELGGLQARTADDNVLTIAFAQDPNAAEDTEQAFKNHAPRAVRPHIGDIMSARRNAVLVWTVTPEQQQLDAAVSCLSP